jgi:predicted dehydrogenase
MTANQSTRRNFLETLGQFGLSVGSLAAVETARGFEANDTIRVACIGTGGRCRTLMRSLVKIPNVRIVAVSDIYDVHLAEGKKLADPRAIETKHYRELLDRKDIDAVLIGSPDHWHVPMTVDACNAGKDVYVEKPLTHDESEGAAVIEARNRNARVVQVGMQQRSMPHTRKARERLKEGAIGRVLKVHMSWNRGGVTRLRKTPLGIAPGQVAWKDFLGTAPARPFDEFQFRSWRFFWDFGGGLLTDLMVHWIDVAHWLLDLQNPLKATTIGNHFASDGVWETPDTIQCLLEYPDNIQAHFEGTFSNSRYGAMICFEGTSGSLYIDRGRYEIEPESGHGQPESWILGTDPRKGRDFYDLPDGELLHLTNWIECIRSRRQPEAPVEAGVAAAGAAHLGNQAYRTGQVARTPT